MIAVPEASALQSDASAKPDKETTGPAVPSESVDARSALPSSLVSYIHAQNYLQPDWSQKAIAAPLVDIARQDGLSDHERFFLGQLYFMAFMPDEAYAAFKEFAGRDDWYGWLARQRLAIMDTRAYENFERLEVNLNAERETFDFDPAFASITGFAERSLCQHWATQGEHDNAVDFAKSVIKTTPRDAAYGPLYVAGACFQSFRQTGRQNDAYSIAQTIRNDLTETLRARRKEADDHPAYDPALYENITDNGWYGRSLLASYNYATYEIEQLIDYYDRFLACNRDDKKDACGAPGGP